MFWKYLLWEFLATVCSSFAMFSFLQILTRTFQAVLSAFHIISSQQSSPHTSSLITSLGTKEHRHCCWSRRANIRWAVCPQLLIHLYLREAIKGFVSMQHWPHWPIYHRKNRTTQAWCLMEVTWKEIWIAYIFIFHHFCAQSSYACSPNSTCHSKGDFKGTSKDARTLSVWSNC